MSEHEQIMSDLRRLIDESDAVTITATSLAAVLQEQYRNGSLVSPRYQFTSVTGLTVMARKALTGRFKADGEETEATQGDLFTGRLQPRYPTQRGPDGEQGYKRREDLTYGEAKWNVAMLRKHMRGTGLHADALEAWA